MTMIRRFFLWYRLLSRRLFKRPAYLAVLLLIPLFASAVMLFSRQDSGVLTIALCLEDPADPLASAVADRLLSGDSVLLIESYETEADAREAVRAGRADAAWIIGTDLKAKLNAFARYGSGGLVTVVEREENVFLALSREKLFAALYSELSYSVFDTFLTRELNIPDLSEEELSSLLDSDPTGEELIHFAYIDGSDAADDSTYVLAPLRGILSLLLLLSALASGMYCYRDEREESFVWLSDRKRRLLPVLCHITAMVPPAIAVLAALFLAGVWQGFGREFTMLLLYVPSCAVFCEIVRCLCPREEHFGALIPILSVSVLVFCPIFMGLRLGLPFRYILPPGHYLNAGMSTKQLWPMVLYLAALVPLLILCTHIRQHILSKQAGK